MSDDNSTTTFLPRVSRFAVFLANFDSHSRRGRYAARCWASSSSGNLSERTLSKRTSKGRSDIKVPPRFAFQVVRSHMLTLEETHLKNSEDVL